MRSNSGNGDSVTDLLDSQPHLGHPVLAVVAALESIFPLNASVTVLDAGCGFGHGSCAIARRFPNSVVTGVDAEADVVSLARARARCLGLESRVGFTVERLALDRNWPGPRFDVLLFLAAQSIFGHPGEHIEWMEKFVASRGVGLVDRTVTVLPGLEAAEEERAERFRAALGIAASQVNLGVHSLPQTASLRAAELLLERADEPGRASAIRRAQRRVCDGEFANSWSALYLVTTDQSVDRVGCT